MKILIAYATKGGAAKECAELLAAAIGECDVCDLGVKRPKAADYDIIVAGTGIRMGRPYRPFREFLEENEKDLFMKKVAFFLCCTRMKHFDAMAASAIPDELMAAAFRLKAFGGKPLIGGKKDQNWMLKDELNAFAAALKEMIK